MAIKALLLGNGTFADPRLDRTCRLLAPANDLRLMRFVLGWRFGVSDSDILVVGANGRATLRELRNGLDRLEQSIRPGDTAVVYFTGHGTKVPNPDRRKGRLNLYGWVPGDASAQSPSEVEPGSLLLSDELFARLRRFPPPPEGRSHWLLLDCCFSGGFRYRAKAPEPGGGEMILVPKAFDSGSRDTLRPGVSSTRTRAKRKTSETATGADSPYQHQDSRSPLPAWTLATACESHQVTVEERRIGFREPVVGISLFTRALYRTLCSYPDATGLATVARLVRNEVLRSNPGQTPLVIPGDGGNPSDDNVFLAPPLAQWSGPNRRFPLSPSRSLPVGRFAGITVGTTLSRRDGRRWTVKAGQLGWFETRTEPADTAGLPTGAPLEIVDNPQQ